MSFAVPRALIAPNAFDRISSQVDMNGGTHFVEITDSTRWKTPAWSIFFEEFSSVEILNRDRWLFGGSSFATQWGPISAQITDNLPGGLGPPQQILVYMGTAAGTQNHGAAFTTGSVIVQDTWQKIAVTFDGTLHVWVNGVDIPLTISAALPANILWGSTNLRIGAPPDSGPANQRFFLGSMRNVAMYDHALSPAEVAALTAGESLSNGRTWWGYTGPASHVDYVHGNNAIPTPPGASGPHFTPYMPGDPGSAMTFVGGQPGSSLGYDYGTMWGNDASSGVAGNTWDAVAPRMLADAVTYNPDAMLVRCGANDLTAGPFPNGRTPEQVRDDTIAAINATIAVPGWLGHVFWMPVSRRGGGAQAPYAATTETLRGYTAEIDAATAGPRVHLIDTLDLSDQIVIAGNGNTQADTTDGLHLLRELNRAESARARTVIASVFPIGPITLLPIGDSLVLYSFGYRQPLKYLYGVINGRT